MPLYHRPNRTLTLVGAFYLLTAFSGCRPSDQPLPTLIPTLISTPYSPTAPPTLPIVTHTPTALPSLPPTATVVVSTTPLPSLIPLTPAPVLPPLIVTANGTLTLTLTEPQLNYALAKDFSAQPIATYAGPPHASLSDGAIDLTITLTSGTPSAPLQSATLTVTLSALSTVSGTVLDIRAVKLSKPDGVSTLQIKPAQALLTTTLQTLVAHAAGFSTETPLEFSYVAVTADKLTLTILTS